MLNACTGLAVHMHKELQATERESDSEWSWDKEHTAVTCAAVMFSVVI